VWCLMKLICSIAILLLLAAIAQAQLAPDRERFDVVLHPGEVEKKTFNLINIGDSPIHKIMKTPIGGSAKDFVALDMADFEILKPKEKVETDIYFAVPPETKTGKYTGYIYLLDAAPPSMPVLVEFNVSVVDQESYGLFMTINDAKSASEFAKADEAAEFDISVKNLGRFRDVASIDILTMPEAWSVSLEDGEKEVPLPYDVPIEPGKSHSLKLNVESSDPGRKGELAMVASSLGNRSQNTSINADAEFGIAVRGYDVKVDVPPKIATNRTYEGAFTIDLLVRERIRVAIMTPPELMVIPIIHIVDVAPRKPGVANFTMLASEKGNYSMIFKLMDSKGVPMPDEMVTIEAIEPKGTVILTDADFVRKAIASLASQNNRSLPLISVTDGKLSRKEMQEMEAYSQVIILGNRSIISDETVKSLQDLVFKRIEGNTLGEMSWKFVGDIWQNGTREVVVSSPQQTDIFRAYREARLRNLPLAICDPTMTDATRATVEDMTKRQIKLNKTMIVGDIGESNLKAIASMGIATEGVPK
jgi:hypothetical protein